MRDVTNKSSPCDLPVSKNSGKRRFKKFIFSEEKTNGCFKSIACQTCDSGIPTNHRCEICGSAFCVFCTEKWGTSGNRTHCGKRVHDEVSDDGIEAGEDEVVAEDSGAILEERMVQSCEENESGKMNF